LEFLLVKPDYIETQFTGLIYEIDPKSTVNLISQGRSPYYILQPLSVPNYRLLPLSSTGNSPALTRGCVDLSTQLGQPTLLGTTESEHSYG